MVPFRMEGLWQEKCDAEPSHLMTSATNEPMSPAANANTHNLRWSPFLREGVRGWADCDAEPSHPMTSATNENCDTRPSRPTTPQAITP